MDWDPIMAIISIIFGIIVIVVPDIIGWIVGIFFVLLGIWLLLNYMNKSSQRQPIGQMQQSPPPAPPPPQAPEEKK